MEMILKSILAGTGISLELTSYLKLMFSEPPSYRSLVRSLGRIKHNPLCPEFKGLLLGEVSFQLRVYERRQTGRD